MVKGMEDNYDGKRCNNQVCLLFPAPFLFFILFFVISSLGWGCQGRGWKGCWVLEGDDGSEWVWVGAVAGDLLLVVLCFVFSFWMGPLGNFFFSFLFLFYFIFFFLLARVWDYLRWVSQDLGFAGSEERVCWGQGSLGFFFFFWFFFSEEGWGGDLC